MMIEKKYNLYSSVSSEVYRELYLKYVEESQSPELMRETLSLLVLARMRNVENIQEKAVNLLSSSYEKLSEKVFDIFSMVGFRVEMNNPFSGGFITKNYGIPKENIHTIQVEIDRSLYMNEANYTLHSGYSDLKKKLRKVICEISKIKKYKNNFLQAAE